MWSVDYVQVPKEDKLGVSEEESETVVSVTNNSEPRTEPVVSVEETERKVQRVADLVKQMSLSAEYSANESGM